MEKTMITEFDVTEYGQNKQKAENLRAEIERLEGFDALTTAQTRKLSALRQSFEVYDELRKEHERAQLLANLDDPNATRECGHTPRGFDDDPFEVDGYR